MTLDATAPPPLELVDISLTYPSFGGASPIHILDSVGVAIAAGEMVAIAGRSGSGKTSLLNIASGLLRPTAGHVQWFGRQISDLDAKVQARVRGECFGIVFQSSGLIGSLTAAENVALAAPTHAGRTSNRHRVLDRLERVGLLARKDHYPHQLSGGEQQRVAVARALCNDPPLLIVDEPTANLDRRTADEIIDVLVSLLDGTRSILVATHDRHLLERAGRTMTLD